MRSVNDKEIKIGAAKYLIRSLIAPMLMAALYFLSAGDTQNQRAWFFFTLFFVFSLLINGILFIKKPVLLYHRSKFKSDAKGWDKWLMPIAVISGFHLQSVIMGFDARFNWSFIDQRYIILGNILFLLSLILSTWAMYVNQHFEAHVRIQKDRKHEVITTGPYAIVRHPGYLAFVLGTLGIPLILGSFYGILVGSIASLLILLRTIKEDNTLKKELEGYTTYTKNVKYRLVPGLW